MSRSLPQAPPNLRALAAALCLVWWATSVSAAEPSPGSAPIVGAQVCASCHQAEYDEWRGSKHAKAFSPTFTAYWKQHDAPHECLACHTTGFDAARRAYAVEGVSCEACHGPLAPGHPGAASMVLPVDSSVCASCHQQTYTEWRLSGHATHNIRCFDCHAVHRQGLRLPAPEQQCGSCHAQRLEDFAHATHHLQGLTCPTCHMPQPRTSGIGGTGAPGHSFFVGAETCAACHEEMVHKSHKLGTLSQEVERLTQQASNQHAEAMQSRLRAAELELDIQRARLVKVAVVALLIGLIGGGLLGGILRRKEPPA